MARRYLVALKDSDYAHDVYTRLSEAYDSDNICWAVEDSVLVVQSTTGDSEGIADAAHLGEERPGIVFRLASGYTGYMPKEFWKWLRNK